ncbi:MAG: response regulator [Candidatus Aminicenantes bacterium]|nr:response regulator [Candidatus Aminicenantes bacterium]NIM80116.1 response regulator [Candidatus Aminicenantes bacterium]NIN19454.1 response regulator [Candidatus Aminicenantes bacterium]NIN43353.1 response regulator [Candidatus Aminicenantes bacterium]NIN86098.1 response regulator [Candidatus Aminicenantes bacterium]
MDAAKILIVEDETIVALDIKRRLVKLGYDVAAVVATGEEAIEKVEETPVDLILMDISLPGDIDGIEAAKRIQGRFDIPVVYLTAHSDKATLERAIVTEPFGYIVKPFDKKTLYAAIEMAIYKQRMKVKIKEKDENFRNLAENTRDGILIATVDGSHVYANQRATEITGYSASQLLKICLGEFVDLDDNGRVSENWLDETFVHKRSEKTIRRENGAITLEMTATKTIWQGQPALLVLFGDISQIKRAEEERDRLLAYMEQARKMEALGTLAGGIAHDFNNILSIILGFTELAMLEIPGESTAYPKLERVIYACLRASDVVKQIMTFSHLAGGDLKPVRISPLIKETLRLMRITIPSTVEIREYIALESDVALADLAQINQVFINLCNNAVDAMREKGGVLEVTLEEVEIEEGAGMSIPGLEPGHFIKLTVADTGHGMGPQLMKRIFEPYFTTKDVGEGTGMGLAVAHGIVGVHGGTITVQSEPGKGAAFNVYLPKSEIEVSPDIIAAELTPTGHERILFVDDEEDVIDLVKQMLEYLGYQVVAKSSSLEALELFKADPEQFDMVIADMVMPNMTGTELVKEILKIRPDISIIILTGYLERISEEEVDAIGIDAVLRKPVVMDKLAQTVRKVLNGV